jgi:hypothetical protein
MRNGIALFLAVVTLLMAPAGALAKACSKETPGPFPDPKAAAELQSADRAALALRLGDKVMGQDEIGFPVKGGTNLGHSVTGASAQVTNWPRKNGERLNARIHVSAQPFGTGNRVRLVACVDSKGTFTAGTYTGTVTVWGPQLREFSYPISVTEKWPWWVPALLIAAVAAVFVVLLWTQPVAPGPHVPLVENVICAAVAIGAAALTYWTVYESNDTWGENPGSDITALVAGAAASAVAGTAVARQRLDTLRGRFRGGPGQTTTDPARATTPHT